MLQKKCNASTVQPLGARLDVAAIASKQTCDLETDILFGGEPSFPSSVKSASAEQDATKHLVSSQSARHRFLQKQRQCSLRAHVPIIPVNQYLSLINNVELFYNRNKTKPYEVSKYTEKNGKEQSDKQNDAVGTMGNIPKPNVLESGCLLNVEEQTRLVQEIHIEICEWRKKQHNAVQCNDTMCIPNVRRGRNDSKKLHQNVTVSDDLRVRSSKHYDSNENQHAVAATNNTSSSGDHRK